MNERIRELIVKHFGLQLYYEGQAGQIEKFAELIVRECTLIVSAIDRAQLRSGEYVDPAEMITKHFGVDI